MDATLEVAASSLPVGSISSDELPELKDDQQREDERSKCRTYWFVVWPESVNMSMLFEVLRRSGLAVVVSPLHCRDFNPDTGERAKEHYHIIVRFPTARYLDKVRQLVGSWIYDAGGFSHTSDTGRDVTWYVRPVPDYAQAVRYLVHKDNPEKARYSENEVIVFGFADLSPLYAATAADEGELFAQLVTWCRNNPGRSYRQLADAVMDSGDMALVRALTRYSYTLRAYISDGMEKGGKRGGQTA